MPTPVIIAGEVIVGDCDALAARGPAGSERLRQAEVQHLHRAVRPDLDVGGLQVAVDDALLVRGFERLGDLLRDRQRLVERNRPLRDAVGERRPLDQLHDEGLHTIRLLQTVDVSDVRMIERGEDLRLSLEPREPVRVRRERIRQHLQGIVPLERRVMGAPDLAHPALANQGGDFIGAEATAGADAIPTHPDIERPDYTGLYSQNCSASDVRVLMELRIPRDTRRCPSGIRTARLSLHPRLVGRW